MATTAGRVISFVALLTVVLVACGAPTTGTGGVGGVAGAVETISYATSVAGWATGTAEAYSAYSTQTAAMTTRTYEEAATATAQAAASATAVMATETAVAPTRTEEARLAGVKAQRDDIQTGMLADSAAAQAELNAQALAHNQELIALDLEKRETEARYERIKHYVTLTLAGLAALVVVVIFALVVGTWIMAWAADRKAQRDLLRRGLLGDGQRPATARVDDANVIEGAAVEIQPASGGDPGRITVLEAHDLLRGRRANWQMFTDWRERYLIPLGAGVDGPVTLNVLESPHLAIVGSSRMGKSTGGLLTVGAWHLSHGAHVLFLNERASNFRPFYTHPNAVHLRAYSLDARMALAQGAVEAMLREMERRDNVLHRAGFNTWHQIVESGELARNPEFGGEHGGLVIVIDEFLSMMAASSTATRDAFMTALVHLTAEAGKFDISAVVAATDPRREALGRYGYTAMQQMARMVFGFHGDGPSLSILGNKSAVNLPVGHFILESESGRPQAGVAFRPSGDDLAAMLRRWPVSYRPTPGCLTPLLAATADTPPSPPVAEPDEFARAAGLGYTRGVVEDARLIMRYAGSALQTRTAIARKLAADGHVGWGSSGENVRRVELALEYLSRARGVVWAADILKEAPGSSLGSVEREQAAALEFAGAAAD